MKKQILIAAALLAGLAAAAQAQSQTAATTTATTGTTANASLFSATAGRAMRGTTLFRTAPVTIVPLDVDSILARMNAPTTTVTTISNTGACSAGGRVSSTQTSGGSSSSVYATAYLDNNGTCTTTLITNP
jgi:hypothetical protein